MVKVMEKRARVPRRESHYHGLLIIDKPGLQQHVATPLATAVADGEQKELLPISASVAAAHAATTHESTPRLYTSHDIVQRVRRWSGQRRIGHTGTLDPMASGVLVLCLGQATRLVEYYQGHDKQYYAEVTLGTATDTYDRMGVVCAESPVPALTMADIEGALAAFRGDIMQLPPVYSALKQGGESLHHKVRRGEVVTVAPRPVTMHQIELLAFTPPQNIALRVICSAGAYIRSLAHDLGQALHTHAHLSLLRREAAGAFTLADAQTLETIEAAAQTETLDRLLLPLGYGLDLAEIVLDDAAIKRLGHGQVIALPAPVPEPPPLLAKGVNADGVLLGILQSVNATLVKGDTYLWKAEKWFATGEL